MTDVTITAAPLSKARTAVDSRRDAILDVAQQVFLEEGFAAASMSTIAARLGGSKGTLYNYFKSKDELFKAYVERRCVFNQRNIHAGPIEGSLADGLRRLGESYLTNVLGEENLKHFRVIIAEAERSPDFGRAFYEAGPKRGAERLAAQLEIWAKDGRLKLDDPLTAAHHFLGLCQNRYFKARMCNAIPPLTQAQIAAEAKSAVDTFLLAFGTASSR
jgi:AcrR family transcriptional regulator